MQEVIDFKNKLANSDTVLLTELENRAYCRFLLNGQHVDKMFITNPKLLSELLPLVREGHEIDANGIAKLRQCLQASDAPSAIDTKSTFE